MGGAGRRAALWIAVCLAIAAPLPFGSVGAGARAGLALAVGAALILLWFDRRSLAPPALPFAVLTGGTLLLAALYFIPAPPGLVETVSPRLARESRLSLAFPGEDASLAGAERALSAAAGGVRDEKRWRPLAVDGDGAIDGATRLLAALGAFLVGLFAAGDGSAARRRIAAAVGISAFVQAAYGLAETLSGSHSIFGWRNPYYPGLASGTFVCPNHFAALLSLGVFALLGLLVVQRPEWPEADTEDRVGQTARIAVITTAAGLAAIAMLWSSSRAALASAVVGLVVLGAVLALRGEARGRLPLLALGGALAVALVAGAALLRPVRPLIADIGQAPAGYESRAQLWGLAADVARAFPLVGAGPGTYDVLHRLFRPLEIAQSVVHAHSDYLEWWAETGLPGLALLVGWISALSASGIALLRRGRGRVLTAALGAGMIALALHETADFSLQLPGVAVPAALLAGAWLAPFPLRAGAVSAEWRRRGVWPGVLASTAVALILAGGATLVVARDLPTGRDDRVPRLATAEQLRRWARAQVDDVMTDVREGQSVTADQQVRLGLAYQAAQKAAVRAPLRADAQLTCWIAAQALASARAPASPPAGFDLLSRHYLDRAVALDPANRQRRLQVARYWLAYGDVAQARRAVRDLLEIDTGWAAPAYEALGGAKLELADLMEATPNRPDAALRLVQHLLGPQRDLAGAQLVLERALSRAPQDPALRRTLASVLAARGRPADALTVLDAAPAPTEPAARRAALLVRAGLLAELKQFGQVETVLAQLSSLGEDPRLMAVARARARSASGDVEGAVDVLRKALVAGGRPLTERQRLDILLTLARELSGAGRFREALDSYREVLRFEPDQAEARTFIARLDPGQPAAH